jgi:hypothetical protein
MANPNPSTINPSLTTPELPKRSFLDDRSPSLLTRYPPPISKCNVKAKTNQKGPEIRTGNTPGDKDIPIKAGHELNITTDDKYQAASDDKNMLVALYIPL